MNGNGDREQPRVNAFSLDSDRITQIPICNVETKVPLYELLIEIEFVFVISLRSLK